MTSYREETNAQQTRNTFIGIAIFTIVLLLAVVYFVFFAPKEDFRLSELQVRAATIVEMSNAEGPWIRVSATGLENERELWIEVAEDFYSKHNTQDQVGILLGKYDQFEVMERGGKTYRRQQRQVWGVEEIYNSLGEAQATNPATKYKSQGSIVSKETKAGPAYLVVVNLAGKQAQTKVDKQLYDQLQVGDKVQGEFESIGEFTRFIGVSK